MASSSGDPTPPDDFPEDVSETLRRLDDHDLQETIIYARELLRSRNESPLRIDPSPGEEIVRMTEREGYTEVVKKTPCGEDCDDCPHGPYLYHLVQERHPSGAEKPHWVLIGRVNED